MEEVGNGKKQKAAEQTKKYKRIKDAASKGLNWLNGLPHRRIFPAGSKKGLILYHLPKEYKGTVFSKLGLVPVYETEKGGTIYRFRIVKSKTGGRAHIYDLITFTEEEARKLVAAIPEMLGDPPANSVQPSGQGATTTAQPEEDEVEMLMRKFRGA